MSEIKIDLDKIKRYPNSESETPNQLIIGKRYWLDFSKTVSGVYMGTSCTEMTGSGRYFNEIQGNTHVYTMIEGVIGFDIKESPISYFLGIEEWKG